MPFRTLSVFAFIFSFFILFSNTYAFSQEFEKHLEIRLLPDATQVKGGQTITVGIEQTIDNNWHTYWFNPGDSGTPARIVWSGLEGLKTGTIQWPVPKHLPMGPLTNFGYEQQVVFLQELTLPQELPDGPINLNAVIDVLVCHEICIPESHTATFTLNGAQAPQADAVERARAKLPLDMGWATSISEEGNDLVVKIQTDMPGAFVKEETIELYPEEWGLIANTAKTAASLNGNTLVLRHPRGERALADAPPVSNLLIAYDDATGHRKGVRVSTLTTPGDTGAVESPKTIGILKAFLFALLGGVILNLMPCVFPVLSMKALSLSRLKDKEIAIARRLGIAYALGILASFALVAGGLIALKAGGAQVGWGFQLQHPAVILLLIYLFFMIALNLSGYFEVPSSLSNLGQSLTKKEGFTGSFFTGVLATIVATPCTAPFMGAAMGYALTQPWYAAMAVFLALGFGLALPYLILSFVPAARHVLPKPGAWMETFRQFLAFPMFASVCWLVWVLAQQVSHMGQLSAFFGMLAIGFALWLFKNAPPTGTRRVIVLIAAFASLVFVLYTFFAVKPLAQSSTHIASQSQSADNWEDFTRTKLEKYLDGDKPVFVNMTAAWCITCKVNEKVALLAESTQTLFKEKDVIYLKGDWTNQNPEITNYLEEYGRSGVPIYVYYGPRDKETSLRPEPAVLPQILTPGIVRDALTATP